MKWDFVNIINDEGEPALAQAPVIISASRSTDIPTFYSKWFIERWKKGYVTWINPFNRKPLNVSFSKTRLVVFWTKNPKPMLPHLEFLSENIPNFYFQFTLNDYDEELLERKVPDVNSRIDTFINLSERIGKEKVIWRFDPIMLTDKISVDSILDKIETTGNKLFGHTEKLVISFADILIYPKVERNLRSNNVNYTDLTLTLMEEIAEGIQKLNKKWNLEISTCSEKVNLSKFGITHNKCVDDDLIVRLFKKDKLLMDFLGVNVEASTLFDLPNSKAKILKDKGQREDCGCIISKDIGQYDTCPHECVYCYANTSKDNALKNYKTHSSNPFKDTIV